MESREFEKHVDRRRLSELFIEQGVISDAEVAHLRECEKCLTLVRVLVGENLNRVNAGCEALPASEASENWYVLKVRERFEPVTAATLRRKGIPVFLPEFKSPELERKEVLFRGYVVSRFALQDQRALLNAPGVLYIMGFPGPVPFDPNWITASGHDFTIVPPGVSNPEK